MSNKRGFTLVEIVVGVGVFLVFAIGIYVSTQFVFRSVYQSRLRIIQSGILNEQVELIRNIPFEDVGIISGSPSGVLARVVTTTVDDVPFTITRTIRNVDDPFDGTIGGNPNDLSPADYKFVDIEVVCDECGQQKPTRITTTVAPKYLEGDPDNGALFVQVFDANAVPVQGANVHIVATSTDPVFDFQDTTDNDGFLRVVDLPGALQAYDIVVTKSGFTTDRTTSTVVNPLKPLASVVAQDVSQVSFSIDEGSTVNLGSINNLCVAVPSVNVSMQGSRLIGTNPDVYKFDQSITTDGNGLHTFSLLDWDLYAIRPTGYDLVGSIPGFPLNLQPGVTQSVQLLVGADTTNSLLVHVTDSITQQPVSNALVHVTGNGFDETDRTGVGHVRQTDWSGGAGQSDYTDNTRYASDDGSVDVLVSPGNVRLRQILGEYAASGELESSTIDLGITPNYVTMQWEPFGQPVETGTSSLKFQIASSNSSTAGTWTYLGPDGTAGTYYDEHSLDIHSAHDGDRFVRYKAYFSTASTTFTPTLSDLSITYTNSCTPPGQLYFGNVTAQEYTVEVGGTGFQTSTEQVNVSGDVLMTVELVGD